MEDVVDRGESVFGVEEEEKEQFDIYWWGGWVVIHM